MSKEFKIEYHGCGACFQDGTRPLISKYKSVPTTDPFWKEIEHAKNIPCTRLQLRKGNVRKGYIEKYKNTVHTKNILKSAISEFEKLKQESE